MEERDWLPGVEPERKCRTCGAAAIAGELCLAHLDDVEFTAVLEHLTAEELILDLRGVEIDNERWTAIRTAMTPNASDAPDLSSALLAGATFGDGADLSEVTFGDAASLRGATFGDGADLCGATFGNEADLVMVTFGGGANLYGATFGDGASLYGATFGGGARLWEVTFGDEASLRATTFGDDAHLIEATFGDGADLSGATFGDEASLWYVTFGDRANLGEVTFGDRAGLPTATFGDRADLRAATFGDGADLSNATFGDGTHLVGATFGNEADLHGATFGDRAVLLGTTFGNEADLHGATFGDRANLLGATFGNEANLRAVTFGNEAELSATTFGDGADLSAVTFGEGARFEDAWFVGKVTLVDATFRGQQRRLGPLYAGGAVNLHDAQFEMETRLDVDAKRILLSRAVFAGPLELRVLRARVEASETRFEGHATIGRLDEARRPSITNLANDQRTDVDGTPVQLAAATNGSVWSLRRTDVSRLTIASVRVDEARFAGSQGLEKLRLLDTRFAEHGGRQRVAEEALLDAPPDTPTEDEQRMGHPKATAEQVAEIYRSLRKSREDAADAPGGNDLYVGEQDMRRRALREQSSQALATRGRRALLALYAWVGGYGVRPVRPFLWLMGGLGVGWVLACLIGLSKGGTDDAFVFALRSMLLLPNSENVTTTTGGDGLQAALRVLGPLLIGLVVLGIRAQVKR